MVTVQPLADRAKTVGTKIRDTKLMERASFLQALELLVTQFADPAGVNAVLDDMRTGEKRLSELAEFLGGLVRQIGDEKAVTRALKDQIDEAELMVLAGSDATNDKLRKAAVIAARKEDPLKTLVGQARDVESVLRDNEGLQEQYQREWTAIDHSLRNRRAVLRLITGLGGEE